MAAKQYFAELLELGKALFDKKDRDKAAEYFTEVWRLFSLLF
jgi:hypothetical protein